MKAIGNFLIIKELRAKEPAKTKGGLLIVREDQENIRYIQGVVVSVGNSQFGIKEGDHIYYDKFAGNGLDRSEDNDLKVIKVTDIVAVI